MQMAAMLAGIALVAWLFAHVEVEIEGPAGWAASLPVSFRVEQHWALDWFWGGRPMTGYHAWVFAFMAAMFHLPMLLIWRWTPRLQARCAAAVMLFWIIEDALWFAVNPHFGWQGLRPGAPGEAGAAWWHTRWLLGLPVDYWQFGILGGGLLWWGCGQPRTPQPAPADGLPLANDR